MRRGSLGEHQVVRCHGNDDPIINNVLGRLPDDIPVEKIKST